MTTTPRPGSAWVLAACVAFWVAVTASVVAVVVLQVRLHDVGRPDLALSGGVLVVYGAAVGSAGFVGSALVLRRRHPVGVAFVTLAISVAAMATLDLYARNGAIASPGELPGADAVAHLVDPLFVALFATVAVALHLTPTGKPLTRRWGRIAWATVIGAGVGYIGGVLSDQPIDPPYTSIENPLALSGAAADAATVLREVGVNGAVAPGLLIAAASLVVRFRRSAGADRQQLLWLTLAAVPIPFFVAVAFTFRNADNQLPLLAATGGWIVLIPVVAWLSISRYHLFDVDRIVSRTLTYTLLTATTAATYAAVVVVSGEALSGRAGSSSVTAILGTLAAVSVAAPARRWLQNGLDRRFNRRRFDALRVVEHHLRDPGAELVDDTLRRALNDRDLQVAYWIDDRQQWVSASGRPAQPAEHAVVTHRDNTPVAALSFDPARVTADLTTAVGQLALAELDNARLRAAVTLKLVEVEESRARIAAAQLEERRRIERNLHDGAQQRLLALGFELRAAQLNGAPETLRAAVTAGIEQAHAAVVELRDLANGLHPAVLNDGGLAGALDDLAARTPGWLQIECTPTRFAPDLEASAWFVICEAVANAIKHANPTTVTVDVEAQLGWLTATVADDGGGGADATGTGIQGMRDRVEAVSGSLSIDSTVGRGTTITARFPCEQ